MTVSIDRLCKESNSVVKDLTSRLMLFPNEAPLIIREIAQYEDEYKKSELWLLNGDSLKNIELDKLSKICADAIRFNKKYEKLLELVNLVRI
jgi:hypothetical protein